MIFFTLSITYFVEKHSILVEFDIERIKAAGYNVITPVVVTNAHQYAEVMADNREKVKLGYIIGSYSLKSKSS